MKRSITITITFIHSILSFLLAFCCIGWIVLIAEGAYINGHIPKYGDIETISFDGLDRFFVGYSLTIMILGGLLWLTVTIINKKLKWIKFNRTIFAIGIISIIVSALIIISPCSTWALD